MTNIESLRLITEAVETAGADIAPSSTLLYARLCVGKL